MQQASSTSLDITEPMLAGSILLRAFSPSRFASPFAQVVGSFRVPFGFSCSYHPSGPGICVAAVLKILKHIGTGQGAKERRPAAAVWCLGGIYSLQDDTLATLVGCR